MSKNKRMVENTMNKQISVLITVITDNFIVYAQSGTTVLYPCEDPVTIWRRTLVLLAYFGKRKIRQRTFFISQTVYLT